MTRYATIKTILQTGDQPHMMKKAHAPDSIEAQQAARTGELIRQYRTAAGLTQTQLAGLVGSSQQVMARYESGEQEMSIGRLVRIASMLGVNPCKLLTDDK